jgi:hypothetical protein
LLNKALTPAVALALLAVFASGSIAQQQQPKEYLTGSATRFTTQTPAQQPPPGQMQMPRYAPPPAYFGADASQFVAGVNKEEVVPPDMMRGWLDRAHPEFRLNAQANADNVLEVKGAWDKAHQILSAMGIPHREIRSGELRHIPLQNVKVLVVNCEGKVPDEAAERVRQWVVQGGYLISTDWTLESFTQKAFPGMIAFNGRKTDKSVVDAIIVNRDPVLFQGIPQMRAAWKLDEESQMVRVLRPDVVRVLARSYMLAGEDPNQRFTRDPNQLGVLACEFPYGRGRVLHLVGHYDYNSPLRLKRHVLQDAIPGAGIGLRQAISTNFLLEGLNKPHRNVAMDRRY